MMTAGSVFVRDIEAIARIDAVPIILSMVKQLTGMRFAAVARVTDKHWVACAVDDSINFGLQPGGELVLESTICHEIRQHRQPVVFGHASLDPVYATHHTPLTYKLESYISIPIIKSNGDFFGTLCAIDSVPAILDQPAMLKTLELFAQLIAASLELQGNLASSELALADANEVGRLREQFIAVLGHDLRTPLSAVRMSSEILERKLTDPRSLSLVDAIRKSAQRMGSLIEDVLDFARGRMGGGIPVKRRSVEDLGSVFQAVIEEVGVTHPDAHIEPSIALPLDIYCDAARLSQLLSNLLVNALTHGSRTDPVVVQACVREKAVIVSVTNQGPHIQPELMPLLFQPFTRSQAMQRGEGLGLGLYIAAQICKAHEGGLTVTSSAENGTCFVVSFPAWPHGA